jgi:hypothetical protein
MPEYRNTGENVSPASLLLPLVCRVNPASALTSVRYRWSRIIPAVPSYGYRSHWKLKNTGFEPLSLVNLELWI